MARHAVITLPEDGQWVELTNADVTAISFQNLGGFSVEVEATSGAAPADDVNGFVFQPQDGAASLNLADLFPGVNAPKRLWARCQMQGRVKVSHA